MMERLVILVPGDTVTRADLPEGLPDGAESSSGSPQDMRSLKEGREQFERQFILRRLQEAEGNVVRAAELLGLERSNLYRKMRTLGIRGGEPGS